MSKYVMNYSEANAVGSHITAQYDTLEGLIGELDRAIGLTYAASGFGIGEIRYRISQQKVLIENQMENLVQIQEALSDITDCTKDYENGARNLIWKAIIIEKIVDFYDYNGNGILSWEDAVAFIDDLFSYVDTVSTISELIQVFGELDALSGLDDFFNDLGPCLKIASILLDIAEGDVMGSAETAIKWTLSSVLKSATGLSGFGPAFLISWAWNAGESIAANVDDFKNSEGVFADGVDASDIVVVAADVVLDSAGETVWDIAHGVVQGGSVILSWITGGETYDEANPEMATYEGFKDSAVEAGEGLVWLASEWFS